MPWRVLWRGTASASHATVVPAPSRICTFFLACFESSIGGRARVGEPRTGRGSGCWDSCPRHRCVRNSLVPAIKSCGAVISEENSRTYSSLGVAVRGNPFPTPRSPWAQGVGGLHRGRTRETEGWSTQVARRDVAPPGGVYRMPEAHRGRAKGSCQRSAPSCLQQSAPSPLLESARLPPLTGFRSSGCPPARARTYRRRPLRLTLRSALRSTPSRCLSECSRRCL